MKLAKWVRFPDRGGDIRILTRAYREWKRAHPDDGETWPGIEEIAAPDHPTATKLAVGGHRLPATRSPVAAQTSPGAGDPSYSSFLSSGSSNQHTGGSTNKGPSFISLHLKRSLPLCRDPAFRLWMILAAYTRTFHQRTWPVTASMFEAANIVSGGGRTRALNQLEAAGMVKLRRRRGRSPVATVQLDEGGFPVPFADAT
jgi:hypothetical protein